MKLETKGFSIMVIASMLLLAGCKKQTGLQMLSDKMDHIKALKSEYLVREKGEKDVVVTLLYVKPNRILFSSEDFVVATNEIDGHFESVFSNKVYDSLPWDGKVYPGTRNLVATSFLTAGPAAANPPNNLAKSIPWKLESSSGGVERYTKTISDQEGPKTFKLEVNDKGMPVQFIGPTGISYIVRKFELVDDIPMEKFRVEPKLGFIGRGIVQDMMMMQTGGKFDWSKFQAATDVSQFKLEGNTLFAIIDPNENTSKNASAWLKTPGKEYRKVTICKGKATSGFFDPTGQNIDKLTSSTPTFVLVNKDSMIIGLWLGFDATNTKDFEADILKAIG